MHRAFHGRRLWKFHSIHHSSVDVDWLSAVRLHPANDVLMRVASAIPVLLLGFAPLALAAAVPSGRYCKTWSTSAMFASIKS
jgi:sterol desaturase/sphingolipid hydroxylase (fatty acid hydroxylase superfamily)